VQELQCVCAWATALGSIGFLPVSCLYFTSLLELLGPLLP
jgi:hypothetical protein